MFRSDGFASIVLIIFAFIVGIQASNYPMGSSLKKIGPGVFPLVVAILLGLLSVTLLIGSIVHRKEGHRFFWPERWLGFVAVVVAIFAYGFLLKYLGFPLASFLFSFALFKYGYPGRWLIPLGGALATCIFSFLVFRLWLGTPFPHGILGY